MRIIWQELTGIFADIWSFISEVGREMWDFIMSNRPQLTVLLTLGLTGLLLLVYSFVGACSFMIAPLARMDNPAYAPLPGEATLFAGIAGIALLYLTVELINRIQKRLAGKPKDDDSNNPE